MNETTKKTSRASFFWSYRCRDDVQTLDDFLTCYLHESYRNVDDQDLIAGIFDAYRYEYEANGYVVILEEDSQTGLTVAFFDRDAFADWYKMKRLIALVEDLIGRAKAAWDEAPERPGFWTFDLENECHALFMALTAFRNELPIRADHFDKATWGDDDTYEQPPAALHEILIRDLEALQTWGLIKYLLALEWLEIKALVVELTRE
jgi:hypothetical protein